MDWYSQHTFWPTMTEHTHYFVAECLVELVHFILHATDFGLQEKDGLRLYNEGQFSINIIWLNLPQGEHLAV